MTRSVTGRRLRFEHSLHFTAGLSHTPATHSLAQAGEYPVRPVFRLFQTAEFLLDFGNGLFELLLATRAILVVGTHGLIPCHGDSGTGSGRISPATPKPTWSRLSRRRLCCKTTLTRIAGDPRGYIYFSFDAAAALATARSDPVTRRWREILGA